MGVVIVVFDFSLESEMKLLYCDKRVLTKSRCSFVIYIL